MWGFFNFSKHRHALNLSHRLISPRHSSCCSALTSAKISVNSEVLTEEYRVSFHFPVFSLMSFLSRIKTQTSRSWVISDMHSDMKWDAVLCVLHPREAPSHRVQQDSGIIWFHSNTWVFRPGVYLYLLYKQYFVKTPSEKNPTKQTNQTCFTNA